MSRQTSLTDSREIDMSSPLDLASAGSASPAVSQHPSPPLPVGAKGRWIWRCANLLATGLFCMCALVQANDPDPYVWIPIYAIPCLLALTFTVRPLLLTSNPLRWLMPAHAAACSAGLAYLIARCLGAGRYGNPLVHEEGRESAGLVLVLAWLGAHLCLARFGDACGSTGMLLLLGVLSCLALLPSAMWSACLAYEPGDPRVPSHCADMMSAGGHRAGDL